MHVLRTQALPILSYGAGVWKVGFKVKQRIGVVWNDCVRKVFGYRRCESIRNVLYGFGMLPMDLFIIRARFLLISSAIRSDRKLVKCCAEYVRNKVNFLNLMLEYGVEYNLSKHNIMSVF
jgi:hypothetical protein